MKKNKTLQAFFMYKAAVLIFLIVGFLAGYFVTEYIINNNLSYYQIDLSASEHPSLFMTEEFFSSKLDEISAYNETAEKKVSIANIEDYSDMVKNVRIDSLEDYGTYRIRIQRKYFPTTFRNSANDINDGASRCAKYIRTILTFNAPDTAPDSLEVTFLNPDDIVSVVGYYNPYYMGLGTTIGMLFISLGFFFIITHSKAKKLMVDISDGELIFKSAFNKRFWGHAKKELSTVKKLCGISVLFALMFICKTFVLPSGFGSLGISLSYLVFSIIGMIYGPVAGIAVGFLSDTLGYFVFQAGTPYFFGYTVNAMLSGFMYGLCFYRTKVTFARCLYARMFVNIVVNVVLGSIWWSVIYGLTIDGFQTYLLLIALPKNLVYLLPQSILLYIILKASARPLSALGLIDERIAENVSII